MQGTPSACFFIVLHSCNNTHLYIPFTLLWTGQCSEANAHLDRGLSELQLSGEGVQAKSGANPEGGPLPQGYLTRGG